MKTKEPQYNSYIRLKEEKGSNELGLMLNNVWDRDPKRLAFVLSPLGVSIVKSPVDIGTTT